MTIVSGPGVKSLNILDPGDAGVIEMVLRVPRIAVEAVHTSRSGEESPLYAAGHRTDYGYEIGQNIKVWLIINKVARHEARVDRPEWVELWGWVSTDKSELMRNRFEPKSQCDLLVGCVTPFHAYYDPRGKKGARGWMESGDYWQQDEGMLAMPDVEMVVPRDKIYEEDRAHEKAWMVHGGFRAGWVKRVKYEFGGRRVVTFYHLVSVSYTGRKELFAVFSHRVEFSTTIPVLEFVPAAEPRVERADD